VSRERRESLGEEERNVFSLDLKTATESLLRTDFGSEFQTAGCLLRPFSSRMIFDEVFCNITTDEFCRNSDGDLPKCHAAANSFKDFLKFPTYLPKGTDTFWLAGNWQTRQ